MIEPVKQALIHIGRKSFHIMASHCLSVWLFRWGFRVAKYDIYRYRNGTPAEWPVFLFAVAISPIPVGLYRFPAERARKKTGDVSSLQGTAGQQTGSGKIADKGSLFRNRNNRATGFS